VSKRISFALGGTYFALGGILWPERQCCQGTKISAEKHTVERTEKRDRIFFTYLSKKNKKGAKLFKG
jgi:hypothetical protein